MAFAGGAHVEEVAGAAGELLDLESEGIASRLRFRLTDQPDTGHPDEYETPEAEGRRARREAARSRERQAAGD
jgi:hypothetical protein